jgi:hypothetical protein
MTEEEANELLKGKVLVPKIGMDKEFEKTLVETIKIAQGPLGWKGQAEIFYSLGADVMAQIGIEIVPGEPKEEAIAKIETYIKQAAMDTILQYGEWITEEEAEQRRKSTKVLYGEPEVPTNG